MTEISCGIFDKTAFPIVPFPPVIRILLIQSKPRSLLCNINRKNSILKISINDKNYLRVQKNNKSRLIKNHEYIKSKNLYKKINNSMSSSIKKNLLKLTENKISKKDINFQKSLVSLMSFFIK